MGAWWEVDSGGFYLKLVREHTCSVPRSREASCGSGADGEVQDAKEGARTARVCPCKGVCCAMGRIGTVHACDSPGLRGAEGNTRPLRQTRLQQQRSESMRSGRASKTVWQVGCTDFCYALQEAAEEEKREAKRLKNEEKRRRQLEASAGSNGEVAALDGVRFKGTFGVSFAPEKQMTKRALQHARMQGATLSTSAGGSMMDEEDNEAAHGPIAGKSEAKKLGFEVARRNYLIKKARKMEKQKEKRAIKNGKKTTIKLKKTSTKMSA